MKSADIKVGTTYLYKRDRYSSPTIVRVERVLTQDERAKESRADGRNVWLGRGFTDTVLVQPLLRTNSLVRSGSLEVESLTGEPIWVRPATILSEDSVEEMEKRVEEHNADLNSNEREVREIVKKFTEALKGTGLPLPEVESPGYRFRFYSVRYPHWDQKNYEQLVKLLKEQP